MLDTLDNPEIAAASRDRGGRSGPKGRIATIQQRNPVRPALQTAGAYVFLRSRILKQGSRGRVIPAGPTCRPRAARPARPATHR